MVVRHRSGLRDVAVALGVIVAAALAAYQIEIVESWFPEQHIIIEEAILFTAVTAICFGIFGFRRIREQEREIRKRIQAEGLARRLAHEDALTGLANRRSLQKALNTAIHAPPTGAGTAHALLLLDLNGFKKVNDQFGHGVGDELLVLVAERFKDALRDGDLLARIGGDEFAILARDVSGPKGATALAKRIVESLERPISISSVEHRLGVGVGTALFPKDGRSADVLMTKADAALYKAKAQGGSAIASFDEEMDRRAKERERLERELELAVGTDAIAPHYQPIVSLRTGEVTGFEVLARWHHPELGNIPPNRFIPIAEERGFIRDLTDQLLRRACEDAARWPVGTKLSFNISPVLLKDEALALRILKTLVQFDFPPQHFQIEITENALVQDLVGAGNLVAALQAAGIRVALDDFGTGASSLHHLLTVRFDSIKIDRSFVERMLVQRESAAIVKMVLGLGHALDLCVTAEGVEDAGQQRALTELGCEQAQGYLFSRAVPSQETEGFFGQSSTGAQLKLVG